MLESSDHVGLEMLTVNTIPVLVCNFQLSQKNKKSPLAHPRGVNTVPQGQFWRRGAVEVTVFCNHLCNLYNKI